MSSVKTSSYSIPTNSGLILPPMSSISRTGIIWISVLYLSILAGLVTFIIWVVKYSPRQEDYINQTKPEDQENYVIASVSLMSIGTLLLYLTLIYYHRKD